MRSFRVTLSFVKTFLKNLMSSSKLIKTLSLKNQNCQIHFGWYLPGSSISAKKYVSQDSRINDWDFTLDQIKKNQQLYDIFRHFQKFISSTKNDRNFQKIGVTY